jgi:hypothetical protein
MIKQLFTKLKAWAQNDFLANSESESNREGYLSYRAEWHAAAWGVAVGVLFVVTGNLWILLGGVGWVFTSGQTSDPPRYLPYPKQFARESLYMIGHTTLIIVLYHGASVIL